MNLHDYISVFVAPDDKEVRKTYPMTTNRPIEVNVDALKDYRYYHIFITHNKTDIVITPEYACVNETDLTDPECFEKYAEKNQLNIKELQDKQLDIIVERYIKSYVDSHKEKLVERINSLTREKEELAIHYTNIVNNILNSEIELRGLTIKEEIADKLKHEIELIRGHKKVQSVEFVPRGNKFTLEINVEDLVLNEPVKEEYYKIADAIIVLNLNEANVKFYPQDISDGLLSYGYWGDGQLHPHVDMEGSPCAGTAAQQFLAYSADMEIYALFITALNFLQTCNIGDVAGEKVRNWTRCSKDGSYTERDLNNRGENERVRCQICGWEMYEDEAIICADCNAMICSDCATRVGDDMVCDRCLDEHYTTCSRCGEYVYEGDVFEVDNYYYCETCYNEIC